jgi:signal transduction histidine kinase
MFIEITNDSPGATIEPAAGEQGRGIAGMRSRAEALGGSLTSGPSPAGGFRVSARLPTEGR